MTNEREVPRCKGDDVDPDWWIEPDIFEDDFGIERNGSSPLGGSNAFTRIRSMAYWNLVRARYFCYQCPLLWVCRNRSWDEPYHVFGGLGPTERYNARLAGRLEPAKFKPLANRSDVRTFRARVMKLFLEGKQPHDIAQELDRSEERVRHHIKGALAEARHEREERDPWEARAAVPPLPYQGMSLHVYQIGPGGSSEYAESA